MAKGDVIAFEPDVITAVPPQKMPEKTPVHEPEKKRQPDFLHTIESSFEKNMGGLLGHALTGKDAKALHHPTAVQARTAAVLQAQQTQGNYYVQRVLDQYQQKSKALVAKPDRDAKTGVKAKSPSGGSEQRQAGAGVPVTAPSHSIAAKPGATTSANKLKPQMQHAMSAAHPLAPPGTRPQAHSPYAATPKGAAISPKVLVVQEDKTKKLAIDKQAGKAAIVDETKAKKPSPQANDAGGAPQADVQQWPGKVKAATEKQLTPSELPESKQAPDQVKAKGDELLQQQQQKKPDFLAEANKAVPPPPKPDQPPEAQPDEIEKSSRDLVASAAGKHLTEQSLPDLEKSKGYPREGTEKKVQPRMPSFSTQAPGLLQLSPAPTDKSGAQDVKTDASKNEDAQRKLDQPATQSQSVSPQHLTLKDAGPIPRPAVPEKLKSDIASALATILSKADDAAKEITDGSEGAAFPDDALKAVAPEVAQKHIDPEKQDIIKELYQVSDAAGLAKEVIDERAQKLKDDTKKQGDQGSADLDKSTADAKQKTEAEGQGQLTAIKSAGESVKDSIEKKKEAAKPLDNDALKEKEKRLLAQVTKDAALANAQYDKALEKRRSELDKAGMSYSTAYRKTAREEAADIKAIYKDNDEKARVESRPSLDWGEEKANAILELLPLLKTAAAREVEVFKAAVDKQKVASLDQVQTWTNHHVSLVLSLWRRFAQLFTSWADDAKVKAEAWEEVRDQETTNQMVADFQTIASLKDVAAKRNLEELRAAVAGLSEEQQALFMLFFRTGSDSVMTVAAAMLSRLEARRIPKLTEALKTEVLELDFDKLGALGHAENPDFNLGNAVKNVHAAVAGIGTNEEKLFAAISGRTPVQIAAMTKLYRFQFGRDMKEDIDDDLSGDKAKRAKAALAGDPTGEDVAALHYAIGTISTDQADIMRILRNKTPEERQKIFEKYKQEYGKDLQQHLHDNLKGDDRDRADALLKGDTKTADAIGINQALYYHWHGGAEVKELDAVYEQIQNEVESQAKARNMTTAEVQAEIKRRSQDIQTAWENKYGGGKAGSMVDAFKGRFSQAEKELALARSESDRTAQDAARIAMESQSLRTTDEKVLQVLASQRQRAETEIRRDMVVHFREQAVKENWSTEERKKKWDELSKKADADIDKRVEKYLDDLDKTYDKKYSKGYGPGELTSVIEMEMDGDEQKMARAIRKKGGGGKLPPEDEVFWSVNGPGTNDYHLKHALLDENGNPKLTKDELKKVRKEYKDKHKRDLDEDVRDDVSGRFGIDINNALKGKPETPQEYREQNLSKTFYELGGSGGVGFLFAPDESIALAKTAWGAEKVYQEYVAAEKAHGKDSPQAKALFEKYKRWSSYSDAAVEGTREGVDVITDRAAMAGAIVVGLVVAVASGGTAVPEEIAAISSMWEVAAVSAAAATGTSMGIKMAMKGNAYSLEEMGTDAVIGMIDIAAAAMTAGIGNALMRTNVLTKLAKQQLIGKLASHGIAHGIGGMIAGLPAGLAGQLLNEQIWKDDEALKTILMGMLQTSGTGLAMGAGMSMGMTAVQHVQQGRISAKAAPRIDPHEAAAKSKPDLKAPTKASVDANPAAKIDSQLKTVLNADERPRTPGTPEAKMADAAAKGKAMADPELAKKIPPGERAAVEGDRGLRPPDSKPAPAGRAEPADPGASRAMNAPNAGTPEVRRAPALERGKAFVREIHAQANDAFVAELLEKGMGKFELPETPKGPPLEPGTFRGDIENPHDALRAYHGAKARTPGREVGLWRNLDTGRYFVEVGGPNGVGAPAGAGYCEAVIHYHPIEGNILLHRMASVPDILGAMSDSAQLNGRPVTQFIEHPLPGGGQGRMALTVECDVHDPAPDTPARIKVEWIDAQGVRQSKSFNNFGEFSEYANSRKVAVQGADHLRYLQALLKSAHEAPPEAPPAGGGGGVAGERAMATRPRVGEPDTGKRPMTAESGSKGETLVQIQRRQARLAEQIAENDIRRSKTLDPERLKNLEEGRRQLEGESRKLEAQARDEIHRLLPEIAKQTELSVEELADAIKAAEGKKGRRLNAQEIIDSLRNRVRKMRPPPYGDLEGSILEPSREQNAIAVKYIQEHIKATQPDAVLAVERGGTLLAEVALAQGGDKSAPFFPIEKHTSIGPDGQKIVQRIPNLEKKILELAGKGKTKFAIVDFYMGGVYATELENMIGRIVKNKPYLSFDLIWMRETFGFETITNKITLRDLEEGVTFPGRVKKVGGRIQLVKEGEAVTLPTLKGNERNIPQIRNTRYPVGIVLGDDMDFVFDPSSKRPIRIFDRNGAMVQEIPVGAPDPVSGKPTTNSRDIVIRLMQGYKFPGSK